ncbi:MAG: hypothetical protein V7459_17365, partial [Oceanicoccus sp.]
PGGARTMEQLCPTQPSAIKNTMNSSEPGYPVISALANLTQQRSALRLWTMDRWCRSDSRC